MPRPGKIELQYVEKCVSLYHFGCPSLGVSQGCGLGVFVSSSGYIRGKSELKDFKVVMFSGAQKLTKTIAHPLHGTPALEHQRQFGNQVPNAIHREGQCMFTSTPQTTQTGVTGVRLP